MKASEAEKKEKIDELNALGRRISVSDRMSDSQEACYIEEIKEMLKKGYYIESPLDLNLGSNGRQGDVLAWSAAEYIKGNIPNTVKQFKLKKHFETAQEAQDFAKQNPGTVIVRSTFFGGYMIKWLT